LVDGKEKPAGRRGGGLAEGPHAIKLAQKEKR